MFRKYACVTIRLVICFQIAPASWAREPLIQSFSSTGSMKPCWLKNAPAVFGPRYRLYIAHIGYPTIGDVPAENLPLERFANQFVLSVVRSHLMPTAPRYLQIPALSGPMKFPAKVASLTFKVKPSA